MSHVLQCFCFFCMQVKVHVDLATKVRPEPKFSCLTMLLYLLHAGRRHHPSGLEGGLFAPLRSDGQTGRGHCQAEEGDRPKWRRLCLSGDGRCRLLALVGAGMCFSGYSVCALCSRVCLIAMQAGSEKGKRLDMVRWVAGFQGMALAAAATEASLCIL